MIPRLLILSSVLALAAGCGGGSSPATSQPSVPATQPTTTTGSPRPPADQAVVEAALADLSQRLGVPEEEIVVGSFSRVTWSDGSLGCPQPGQVYTQALVEGSRVVLVHGADTYDYHAGSDDEPFLCERPTLSSGPGLTVPAPTDR
ncbi:MAG: hypothetical protein WB239_16645 [Acidimicrobiia bacterium]